MNIESELLSRKQASLITGRMRVSAQARWFQEHGIPCFINAANELICHQDAVRTKLGALPGAKESVDNPEDRLHIEDVA